MRMAVLGGRPQRIDTDPRLAYPSRITPCTREARA